MVDHVGKQLGNYRLIRFLGRGGFAEVYLGEHVYLGTKAAIKMLHTQLAKDDLEGFHKEARTIAELVHPNIVRILDFGVEGHTPFLVMEYAANGTLRERHPKGNILSSVAIATYLKDVATALQYAHERKLIHRDIKPENMLLGQNSAILLSDFGIALIAQSTHSQKTQEVAGTIAYMAPEQLQGKPRFASDQYALGVVVYEWLSGERPFRGTFTEIASQHVLTPPPPLRAKIPSISPAIEEVVFTALAKDPHQRFSNVQAFATAFEQASHSQSTIPAPESQENSTPFLQPTQLATPLPSSSIGKRPQTTGTYSAEVRTVPQPRKAPNFGLFIGIGILLILVISGGSFYLFSKGGSGNPGNTNSNQTGNNGSGTTTNTGGGVPTSTLKVALVTDVGGLNDGGFNQLAYTGYEKARAQYGFPDVVIQTQTPTASEYLQNLTSAANQADMVIAVGFLMETPLDQVAKQFTTKKFAIVDGCAVPDPNTGACENLSNVAPLFFKEQEAGCLVGAIAGQVEVDGKSAVPHLLGMNTIGAVGGLPIPPVNRYIAGYKYCATKVDPTVKVVVGYSNNFSDPTICKDIANKQITDNMADIIFQVAGGCGIGVFDAAKAKNVYSIGVDVDQSKDSTGAIRQGVITSALKRVDTAVFSIIDDAEKSTYAAFVSSPAKFDLAHDGVGYGTTSSDVPADVITTANNYASMIKSGTLVPPETIP